jgi:hypothetical protein
LLTARYWLVLLIGLSFLKNSIHKNCYFTLLDSIEEKNATIIRLLKEFYRNSAEGLSQISQWTTENILDLFIGIV